jgi:hypothetical protein
MDDRLSASTDLQELKEALAESPPLGPVMPNSRNYKKSIQPEVALSKQIPLSTEEPSKVAHIGNTLNPR